MKKNIKTYISSLLIFGFLCIYSITNAQKNVGGNYTLTDIKLEDASVQDSLKTVPVFEDANINCLLNSQWTFGNGLGSYKIDQTNDCTKGMRQINWKFFNLKGSDFFQFCRTSAVHGVAADEHCIYVCEVQSSAKQNFTLRYPILFEDKPNAILLTFIKN